MSWTNLLIRNMGNSELSKLSLPHRKRPWEVITICGLIGIISLFVGAFWLDAYQNLQSIVNVFGQALLVGALVSFLIDLPTTFSYFQKVFLHTLTSDDYLSGLTTEDLTTLRKICTKHINIKHIDKIDPGLIELDERILSQLSVPYYERFRQTISATYIKDDNSGKIFLKKHVTIEKKLINPHTNKTVHPDIGLRMSILRDPHEKEIEDYFKLNKFTVKIDSGKPNDIAGKIDIKFNIRSNPNVDSVYNTDLYLTTEKSISEDGIEFEFNECIDISCSYDILVPCEDKIFTKRVELPTKSFIIDYTIHDKDLILCGDLFGTMQYRDKKNYKVTQKTNGIFIESYEWILPGDGVYIVELANENH